MIVYFDEEGDEEGDRCNRNGCDGTMKLVYDGPCICNVVCPPCPRCENGGRIECSECGFIVGEDE